MFTYYSQILDLLQKNSGCYKNPPVQSRMLYIYQTRPIWGTRYYFVKNFLTTYKIYPGSAAFNIYIAFAPDKGEKTEFYIAEGIDRYIFLAAYSNLYKYKKYIKIARTTIC